MRLEEDWLESYLKFQENTEPPVSYHKWVAISCIAAALQRKCWLDWGGGLVFYPNMYIVLVGPPGKTRKGTALKVGKQFMAGLKIPMSAEATTREAFFDFMELSERTEKDANGKPYSHSSVSVISEELTVFLGNQDLIFMDNLTDFFDCADSFTYRTKGSGTNEIKGVWLNLLGGTTVTAIRNAIPADMIGGGFASRIVFVHEERKSKTTPIVFYTKDEERICENLKIDLAKIHALKGGFKVTKEFIDRWVEWYTYQDEHPPFKDPHFDGYMSRRQVHVLKLSMICNASHSDDMIITDNDLNRAITTLEEVEIMMPKVFSTIGKHIHVDIIANLMSVIEEYKEVRFGMLMKIFVRDIDSRMLETMVDSLVSMRFCTFERNLHDLSISIIRFNNLELK